MSSNALVAMGGNQFAVADPAAIAAAEAAKARIQAAYIMALNKPRSEDQARIDILAACKRPEFAARAEFAKPIGKDKVRGPSIRFAELALRTWGNVDSDVQVVYEDDNIRRVKVRIVDLQTNATFGKEIAVKKVVERRSKKDREQDVIGERKNSFGDTVYLLRATDDELMVKENALISKVIRNEGLRLIPGDIVDEAIETARNTLKARDAKDPAAARKAVLDAFASVGVKPVELQKYLKHTVDTISPAELEELRRMYQAIKDGDASWRDYIDQADQQPQSEDEKAAASAASKAASDKFEQVFAAELADQHFGDFVYQTSKTYNTTIETVRADMLNQPEAVKAGFQQWKKRNAPKEETKTTAAEPAQPAADTDNNEPDSGKPSPRDNGQKEQQNNVGQADNPPGAASKEDTFRAEWINLKPQGFGKYVERNLERFQQAAPWLKEEAVAKWKKFYTNYPCPIGQTPTETGSEMASETNGEAQGRVEATGNGRTPADTTQAQPASSPADVQRLKVIDEIKRYPDAVVMEAKRRAGVSIMPSQWPPSLEGCARLLDQVNAVSEEHGKKQVA